MSATKEAPGLVFEVPIRTDGGDNDRRYKHWGARKRRADREHAAVYQACSAYHPAEGCNLLGVLRRMVAKGPLDVVVTRITPATRLSDPQNLGSKLKGVVDAIAKVLGVDDGDPRVVYRFREERGPWGVRVEVSARKPEVQGPGWTAEEWGLVAFALAHDARSWAGSPQMTEPDAGRAQRSRQLADQAETMARALGGGG